MQGQSGKTILMIATVVQECNSLTIRKGERERKNEAAQENHRRPPIGIGIKLHMQSVLVGYEDGNGTGQ